jgi:hypothetical protein
LDAYVFCFQSLRKFPSWTVTGVDHQGILRARPRVIAFQTEAQVARLHAHDGIGPRAEFLAAAERAGAQRVLLQRRAVKESSGSGIELKQAAEPVATAYVPAFGVQRCIWRTEEKKIALTLMVAFKVMIFDVVV